MILFQMTIRNLAEMMKKMPSIRKQLTEVCGACVNEFLERTFGHH